MRNLLFLIVLIFIVSCKPKAVVEKETFYSLEADTIKFGNGLSQIRTDTLFTKTNYVPLENTKASLVGKANKVIISEGITFILDSDISKSLFLFNNEGKLISKIAEFGDHPGGYKSIVDFSVDVHQKQVIILDERKQKILYYDFNGLFIKKQDITYNGDYIGAVNFVYSNNEFIFNTNNNCFSRGQCFNLYFFNKNLDFVSKNFFTPKAEENLKRSDIGVLNLNSEGNMLFNKYGSDMVYTLKEGRNINGKYLLDFGAIKSKDLAVTNYNKLSNLLQKKNQTIGAKQVFETDKWVYGNFLKGQKSIHHFFYDKHHKINYYSDSVIPSPSGVFISEIVGVTNNTLIGVLSSEFLFHIKNQLKKVEDKKIIDSFCNIHGKEFYDLILSIEENSNPILCFYEFK